MMILEINNNANGKMFADRFVELAGDEAFYKEGELYGLKLNGQYMGSVELESKRDISLSRLTDSLSYLNSGHPAHYQSAALRRRYKMDPNSGTVSVLIFKYFDRDIATTSRLLQEWWREKSEES